DVLGKLFQARRRTVNGVDRGDGLLNTFAFDFIQAGGGFVGGLVEGFLADLVVEFDADEPRLEVNGHGGPVVDGPSEVIDVDVVASLRFVDDDNDVVAVGQQRMVGTGFAFEFAATEFLERGEVDPAGGPGR